MDVCTLLCFKCHENTRTVRMRMKKREKKRKSEESFVNHRNTGSVFSLGMLFSLKYKNGVKKRQKLV